MASWSLAFKSKTRHNHNLLFHVKECDIPYWNSWVPFEIVWDNNGHVDTKLLRFWNVVEWIFFFHSERLERGAYNKRLRGQAELFPNYLSRPLPPKTGRNAQSHIQCRLIRIAKTNSIEATRPWVRAHMSCDLSIPNISICCTKRKWIFRWTNTNPYTMNNGQKRW